MSSRWQMPERMAAGMLLLTVALMVAAALTKGYTPAICACGALALCGVVFWASKE